MFQSLLTFAFGIAVGIAIVAIAWRLSKRAPEPSQPADVQPLNKHYLQGLNFVINEEPDKALDVFTRLAELDNDTVETHLALGNLYRRRGEVDRAIRIHEHIMSRQSLTPEHREHAVFALGEDYFRAGLFDRAEATFRQLIDKPGSRVAALRFLLRIYEQQADWLQAVEAYSQLQTLASPEHPTAIAHYYCELAELARQQGQREEAREWLHKMRDAQRNFPRGALVRAELAWDDGDMPLAARLLYRVFELHPQLLPVALQRYARAAQRSGGPSLEGLRSIVRTGPAARAELAYAGIVAGLEQETFVLDALPDLVRQDPSLSDVVPALAGDPSLFDEPRRRALATALSRVVKRGPRYRCVDCGLPTATHFWQCPGCRSWDTLAPVGRVELLAGVRGAGPR
jgi:lipopolysaccharide biosynthesis regulator YciM